MRHKKINVGFFQLQCCQLLEHIIGKTVYIFLTIKKPTRRTEECVRLHIKCAFSALLPPECSLISLTYIALLLISLGQLDGEKC